ncbi:MAG TPA: class I SAM-dependent methyltransferase [Polyangiaceae bacterium]|jgi:SAM-dependent methyltransferase|nr:class I SAM-dependent methyltransferase [Polyangiaceae bacterium]
MDRFRRFDEAYYHRFYEDPKTRVVSDADHAPLPEYVFAVARYNSVEIKSVLDVGAGVGLWKRWIAKHTKGVEYLGTEVSQAMCKKHGFEHRDIARWRDRKKYDLIICQGVLQYLPDPDVAPAVANIGAMAGGLVYFEAMTRGDVRDRIDKERSDTDVHIRNGSYYRGLFAKHFVPLGLGLHWPKDVPLPFWELDVAGIK